MWQKFSDPRLRALESTNSRIQETCQLEKDNMFWNVNSLITVCLNMRKLSPLNCSCFHSGWHLMGQVTNIWWAGPTRGCLFRVSLWQSVSVQIHVYEVHIYFLPSSQISSITFSIEVQKGHERLEVEVVFFCRRNHAPPAGAQSVLNFAVVFIYRVSFTLGLP